MNYEERVMTLVREGNPIPDPADLIIDLKLNAVYLATLEQRSSEMTQLDTKTGPTEDKKRNRVVVLGIAAVAALLLAVAIAFLQEDDQTPVDEPVVTTVVEEIEDDNAELLAEYTDLLSRYAEFSNSGDVFEVMNLYYQGAPPEMKRHPYSFETQLWETAGVRSGVELLIEAQGSGTGLEFFDIEVSDGSKVTVPDITFSWRFLYGSDGSESGGEAGCLQGNEGKIFIRSGEINQFDWGFNPGACTS